MERCRNVAKAAKPPYPSFPCERELGHVGGCEYLMNGVRWRDLLDEFGFPTPFVQMVPA